MASSRNIFEKRVAFKPFEYPDMPAFKDAINHSFWLVSEWNFIADIQDFHVRLNDVERSIVKNTLLAISQIEVSVKKFWGKLGDICPKPEIDQVGICFASSEVRHADAYSHLLEVLSLNQDFELLLQNPVIQGRVDYLTKYMKGASDNSTQSFAMTLALFSLFIENVSLFSQFAIIKAFNKNLNILKDIDNVIQATQLEEQLHAQFGICILMHIKEENPDWFDDKFYEKIYRACKKAYESECEIIDWIFEQGELRFLPKAIVKEFIKNRFNQSVEMMGGKPVFEVDETLLESLRWFDEELLADLNSDFFNKRPVSYSKKTQAINPEELF